MTFQDDFDNLDKELNGLKNLLIAEIQPYIIPLIKAINKAIRR